MIKELLALNYAIAKTPEQVAYAQETEAMFLREVAYKRLVRACPHNGGWAHLNTKQTQCQGCGLVAGLDVWQTLVRYPLRESNNEALGTALVDWDRLS